MAMCEEVVLDDGTGALVTEGDGRTLKRVQIKLEHGLGVGGEVPSAVDLQSHRSPDAFLAAAQEEVVIHQEAEEMQQQHFQQQQHQERTVLRDDPLARAIKVTTQTSSGADLGEQGMPVPGILTANGTVVRVGSATPQQGATSVQSAIVSQCLMNLCQTHLLSFSSPSEFYIEYCISSLTTCFKLSLIYNHEASAEFT